MRVPRNLPRQAAWDGVAKRVRGWLECLQAARRSGFFISAKGAFIDNPLLSGSLPVL
jgi:hypothetical protein